MKGGRDNGWNIMMWHVRLFLKNMHIKICLDEGTHSMVYHYVGEDRLYWTPYEQKHFDTNIEREK
jgi:hypothetical protein